MGFCENADLISVTIFHGRKSENRLMSATVFNVVHGKSKKKF